MSSKKVQGSAGEKKLSTEELEAKICEIRKLICPAANKLPFPFSDATISRYLRARNSNTKKAAKMLKDTIKWRTEYKPEKIQWEDIAKEAETGKIYRANYHDKQGRTVLVMRPGFQNTKSSKGQIMFLVYCMENAMMNLNPNQEEMVWLIDFQGWTMSSVSLKVTQDTVNILQDHYPETLGLAIIYNPPKIFESFWTMVKPFLEPKTYKKVTFIYCNDGVSQQKMEELFDMDALESSFGGRNSTGFDYETYAKQMMEEDKKMANLESSGGSSLFYYNQPIFTALEASNIEGGIASSDEKPTCVRCKAVSQI